MIVISSIARRYAKAFIEAASAADKLGQGIAELNSLAVLFKASEDFRHILMHPVFKEEERLEMINKLEEKLKLSQATINLIKTLIHNKRVAYLAQIAGAVEEDTDKIYGRVRANIKTAVPLPLGTLKRLQIALEEKFKKKVELTQEVAPDVIAGILAQVGNIVVDGTIKSRLDAVKKTLTAR